MRFLPNFCSKKIKNNHVEIIRDQPNFFEKRLTMLEPILENTVTSRTRHRLVKSDLN